MADPAATTTPPVTASSPADASSASFATRLRWRRAELGRFHLAVALVALAGFVFRAGYVLVAKRGTDACDRALCGDAFWYSASANSLAHGRIYEDPFNFVAVAQAADHPPLTTLVLAPASVLGWGYSITVQRLTMAFLGTLVIVVAALLARRLAGDGAGIATAVVAAANPNLWMNDVIVMSETVGTLALLLVIFAAYRLREAPGPARAAVAGLALGVAGLARAELLLYGPVLLVPLCLLARSITVGARLRLAVVCGAAALAALAPWTVFNLTRFDRPVLISTNDGLTLVGANCDRVYGIPDKGGVGFWNLACRFDADEAYGVPALGDQSVQAARYREIGLDYIATHKRQLPEVLAVRTARVWGVFAPDQMVWLNQGEGRDTWASVAGYGAWWAMILPAAWGARVLRRRGVAVWPLLASIPVVTLTGLLFYGIVRFRLPADVSATVLTGVAVHAAVLAVARRRSGSPGGPLATTPAGADPTPAAAG